MKTFKRVLTACLLAIILTFTLAACAPKSAIYVEVLEGDKLTKVTVDLSKFSDEDTLLNVLKSDKVSKKLQIEFKDSEYGAYVIKALSIKEDFENKKSIAVYSTDESYKYEYSTEYVHGGVKYYTTSAGVSGVKLKEGVRYLFKLDSWA